MCGKFKRQIGMVMALVLILGLNAGSTLAAEEVRIGGMLALTGTAAPFNEPIIRALELARDEINKKGGVKGKELKLFVEDSKGEPQAGVAAFNKLVNVDKVPAIIGTASPVIAATLPLAERSETVLIDIATISPKIWERPRKYSFSIYPKANVEMVEQARFAYNVLNARKAAVLAVNTEIGQSSAQVFADAFAKLGGKVTGIERYPDNMIQFQEILSRVNSGQPDIVSVIGSEEVPTLVRQSREMGLKLRFIAYSMAVSVKFIQSAGQAAEGMLASSVGWNPEDPSPEVQNFIKAFRERYNDFPMAYAATGYDAVYILSKVIGEYGENSKAIVEGLHKIDYKGASGRTKIGRDGLAPKEVYFKIVKNGQWIDYAKAK